MKISFLILLLLSTSDFALANTATQAIKSDIYGGCISRGISRGESPDAVSVFCSCTWDVLSNNLTLAEYIKITETIESNRDPSVLPFWKSIEPKLEVCHKNEPHMKR